MMNKIKLVPVTKKDKELLTAILVKSFDSDTQYYYGEKAKGGPPGYDNGELSIKIIDSEELDSFLIKNSDSLAGCISLNIYQREIAYFCLLPEYQSKGLGTIVWEEIEKIYGTNDWSVETPAYSLKNHAFYKKLGFKKIYEKTYSSEATSYVFEKNDISKLSRKKNKRISLSRRGIYKIA